MASVRATLDVIDELLAPAGRAIVDVGCGDGALVRALAKRGARMVGVEVSDDRLACARAHPPVAGETYLEGTGQALPVPADSADAVVFVQSLHHVPPEHMDAALAEAARVAPVVYVQEPLAQGPFFALVALVDDETRVRALAQEAIARSPLTVERELRFDVPVHIGGLDDLRARIVGADPARAQVFAAREVELRAGLAGLGAEVSAPSVAHLLHRA
ncbi:MAG: class I SAM-dependent methyltransferase [Actinomycetota bacterium]|nr:class I SAM-dependent methyltransferase [Actinomycetota bacterium]